MISPMQAFTLERTILAILASAYGLTFVFYCPPKTRFKQLIKTSGFVLHVLALALHSFLVFLRIISARHLPLVGTYENLLFLSWCVSFVFLVLSWKKDTFPYGRGAAFGAWICVLSLLIMHASNLKKVLPRYLEPILGTTRFEPHAAIALLAYACFLFAFFAAVTSLVREEKLKAQREGICEFYLWPGVILLTASVILGAALSRLAWGSWWVWEPKMIFSLVTWMLFVLALALRREERFGRIAFPWFVIAGFVLMTLTYFAANRGMHDFL